MKQTLIFLLFLSAAQLYAQNTGVNSTNPEYTLDVRSLNTDDPGQFNVSNSDKSRFVRFFSGSSAYPDPSMTWKPGHNFLFATYDDITFNFNEFMRIDSIGDVGIGIFNPEARLDIKGGDWNLAAGNPGDLRIGDALNNLRIGVATGGGGAGISRMYSSDDLIFGVDSVSIMTLTGLGNVGVNNSNPLSKLDIKNIGDGAELLRFTTDRPWVFKQTNSGGLTNLTLQSTIGGKIFEITSPLESKVTAAFRASDTNPETYLVPEEGRVGIGTYSPTTRTTIVGSSTEPENILKIENAFLGNNHIIGLECTSYPAAGYGIGANFYGGYRGLRGVSDGGSSTGTSIGLVGTAHGIGGNGIRIGVHGEAYGGDENWAGYFNQGHVYVTNDLRIGFGAKDGAPGYKVAIDGKLIAEEVRVQLSGDWPDYVFEDSYDLTPLNELEKEITNQGHLPGVPSAKEVAAEGILLGEMQKILLEKIEELTLYTIDLQKQMETLKSELASIKSNK